MGEPDEYGYSKMQEPYEYGYSRVEEPHEYGYFRTEELHEYGYLIVKKLDGDIQGRHGFQIFCNCGQADIGAARLHTRRTLRLKPKVMSWSANTSHFVIKKICCTTGVAVCVVTAGRLITIY